MSCKRKIDSKIWLDYWTMENEVRSLKQELTSTRKALKSATKRCRELVRELDSLHACHESERNLQDQQLSKILRALLILESRLRQEQKSIRQQLCEKDNVIRNQQIEIARLRRYTKNYIKNTREKNSLNSFLEKTEDISENPEIDDEDSNLRLDDGSVAKDIQQLKREIITKLNGEEKSRSKEFGVKKTDSFAGSDVSKESITSENIDGSIVTTTTDGSPSLVSTEGFCEGESSDVSPGSTLNKSSRRTTSESDTEATQTILDDLKDCEIEDDKFPQRRNGVVRSEPLEIYENQVTKISRSDSKDDGMDCNFISEDEELEPIYVNSYKENNAKNLKELKNERIMKRQNSFSTKDQIGKIGEEKHAEETSGNWYSDPDEDRISDETIQHNVYRSNSNHNSVLECVNQILLRDMEEEESVLSAPRTFKHRGRIVRFQPARLSDIESVGSEMERKNSEETSMDKEVEAGELDDAKPEDEFGARIINTNVTLRIPPSSIDSESSPEEDIGDSQSARAIPIVIIEPKVEVDTISETSTSPNLSIKSKSSNCTPSPILRLERIEEKTCLSMSSKGLTIAKNLDYEDIESLPEIMTTPKTPPALPPKPQFRNNTLVLKKIPSPSFFIDETRKKHSSNINNNTPGYVKRIFGISTPTKSSVSSVKSLIFDDKVVKSSLINNNFQENKFKSSIKEKEAHKVSILKDTSNSPRVTNMVRHFEEFKIGCEADNIKRKIKERQPVAEMEEIDIRQAFEEFNLDECDLSDDPDRPEGDGSDRLGNSPAFNKQGDSYSIASTNNNNVNYSAINSNGVYDNFLEATGLSNKSILTPSRLISNHKSVLKPKDIKYKNKIKAVTEKQGVSTAGNTHTYVRHWTGPFV
ncbi:uncharacterized protein [Chelonus insularis]|uniref:uncharacterized protein isoform X2 n=1 Tax=Chelonus insularis TaxID=460826 RepID=UPI00158DD307|nr:uncharacterized protein LOC118064217 isoform X2 [Chelonus insularis]